MKATECLAKNKCLSADILITTYGIRCCIQLSLRVQDDAILGFLLTYR